jgi:hypothetical protein
MTEQGGGKRGLWVGRVVSAIPVLMLVMSGAFKLVGGEEMAKNWVHLGYPPSLGVPIGVTELLCALLYVIPRTSVLGAILITGYLGGAVATHVRMLEASFPAPAVLGALAWLGLYLRDPRLRELLPLRREP